MRVGFDSFAVNSGLNLLFQGVCVCLSTSCFLFSCVIIIISFKISSSAIIFGYCYHSSVSL